ncbi:MULTISPECIES: hypothetical protein [Pseudoalteromonas]|jgi:hypothetical protein|uniref:hypothetical protein n=1 Tax=Pseudoalteromonas TaxID=53246 RepID=UPI0002CC99BE|nr:MULTISPECIES: hypothetical protein [Pseudoalteromonas]MCP4053708.1 hypothetical protein [Mesoflavibacter sp.]ENN98673.1 signal peptide-containing protein [Pseudoalteromonas agarivorans S816]MDI3245371.1 hypothetical protein [Pseudoalteromonas agarivorans]TMS70499.1 hypothetical protein CWB83_01920 [Pseudoalteromonas sp. S1691]TMS72141.1 hypothetical protein CWB86_03705 [Pseudoalteromonas sp. S1731]
MRSLILASLFVGASSFVAFPVYAQAHNDVIVQTDNLDTLINILTNATADTPSEELQEELVVVIEQLCQNTGPVDLDSPIANGTCSAQQLDIIMNAVISAIGADSPFISDFLAALVTAGVNSDAVTLAAITAGVDATIASQATAAGPTEPTAPASPLIVTLPTTTVPQGAGGTGGDAGISEVGN